MAYSRSKYSLPSASSQFEARVKEILEIREGVRSKSNNSFVTFGDLEAGQAVINKAVTESVPGQMVGDGNPPNPPTDLTIETGFLVNKLSWTNPSDSDAWYIEIWCATTQSRSAAERIGIVTLPGDNYAHSIPAAEAADDHYYWIRTVDYSGLYSEWEPNDDQGGYLVTSDGDISAQIDQVISQMTGAITDTQLHNDLSTRINKIDVGETSLENLVDGLESDVDTVRGRVSTAETDLSNLTARVNPLDTGDDNIIDRMGIVEGDVVDLDDRLSVLDSGANTVLDRLAAVEEDLGSVTAFDSGSTYAVGELVLHNSIVYKCISAITSTPAPEPPNETYWEIVGEGASLTDVVSGNSTAISDLETTVNDTETGVVANASELTALQSYLYINYLYVDQGGTEYQLRTEDGEDLMVSNLALRFSGMSTAIDELETTTTEHDGRISTNASAITALQSTVNDPEDGVEANATALTSLTSRVSDNETGISTQASRVDGLEATVNDAETGVSANATAVDSLDTRVTVNESDISDNTAEIESVASSITNLSAYIHVGYLYADVTGDEYQLQTEDGVNLMTDNLDTHLGALSEATDILDARVTINESSIVSQSAKLTGLESVIYDESGDVQVAYASALETLETTVSSQGDTIDEVTAKWTIQLNANDHVAGVGLMLDGVTGVSNFEILADTFAVVNPGDETEDPKVPFIVGDVGGVSTVGINGALVVDGSILADSMAVTALSAITANLGTVTAGVMKSSNWGPSTGTHINLSGLEGGSVGEIHIGGYSNPKLWFDGDQLQIRDIDFPSGSNMDFRGEMKIYPDEYQDTFTFYNTSGGEACKFYYNWFGFDFVIKNVANDMTIGNSGKDLTLAGSEIKPQSTWMDLGTSSYPWDTLNADKVFLDNWRVTTSSDVIYFHRYSTAKAAIDQNGNLYAAGVLLENHSFSLDLEENNKWDLLYGLVDAFQSHDESKAPELLKYRIDEEDEYGKTGKYNYCRKPADYIQILLECVHEMKDDLEALKSEKQDTLQ